MYFGDKLQQVIGASELNSISCEMLGVDSSTHPDINTVAQYAALINGSRYGAVAIQCIDNDGNPMANIPFVINNSVHTTNENGVFIHKASSGSFSASFDNCIGYSFNPPTISTTLVAGQVQIYQVTVSEDTSKSTYQFDTSQDIIFAPNVQSIDVVLIGGGAGGDGGGGGGGGYRGMTTFSSYGGNGGNGGRGGNGKYQSTGSKQVAGSAGTNGTAGGRGGNGAIFIKLNYKSAWGDINE